MYSTIKNTSIPKSRYERDFHDIYFISGIDFGEAITIENLGNSNISYNIGSEIPTSENLFALGYRMIPAYSQGTITQVSLEPNADLSVFVRSNGAPGLVNISVSDDYVESFSGSLIYDKSDENLNPFIDPQPGEFTIVIQDIDGYLFVNPILFAKESKNGTSIHKILSGLFPVNQFYPNVYFDDSPDSRKLYLSFNYQNESMLNRAHFLEIQKSQVLFFEGESYYFDALRFNGESISVSVNVVQFPEGDIGNWPYDMSTLDGKEMEIRFLTEQQMPPHL